MNNTICAFASLPASFEPETRPIALGDTHTTKTAPRLLHGRILRREEVAEDIVCLDIGPDEGEVFPSADPGAHIDVHIQPGLVRQYSLTGRLQEGRYRIAILRKPESEGGSEAMHRLYREGSKIVIGEPRNNFPLDTDADNVLLIAGGVGLTPLLAMAWHLHLTRRSFALHIAARKKERLPFADRLSTCPFVEHVHVHLDDGPEDQRFDLDKALTSRAPSAHLYLCGPKAFMAAIERQAIGLGLPEHQIHTEYFAAEIDPEGESFTVVAARSGQELTVGRNQTILAVLEQAGIAVQTSCRNGVCGSCLTPVLAGTPDHRDMMQTDAEKAANHSITVCCSRSKTKRLILDI